MNTRIVIDSTFDLPAAQKARCTVVPLAVYFGEEEYIDGVTITHEEFYEKLVSGPVMPTTSQPTPAAFHQVFSQAVEQGEQVVALTIASKLSGTYQSACIAAEDYPGDVFVVDTGNATIAAGILALRALELAQSGLSARDIAGQLERERGGLRVVAMLDTLEYMKRGGRVSKTVAFAGGLLSIKPLICVQDGQITVLGKARGSKQGYEMISEHIRAMGGADVSRPILLGYTGTRDTLLQQYIGSEVFPWKQLSSPPEHAILGTVIGTHAGPGAVATAFFLPEEPA